MNQSLQALLCLALVVGSLLAQPAEQGFVYQGQLQSAGNAFEGTAEMRFRLFDSLEGGVQIGSQVNRTVFVAAGGLFTVSVDFGPAAFDGQAGFLEIDVMAGGDPGFTTLTPRQRLAPTPMASVARRPWTISGDNAFFAGGNLGVGEVDPLVPLHLTNGPLFLGSAALFQDDLLIEDNDAILGLASNGAGAAGSGIVLKQINLDGTLFDTWGIYRSTSDSLSELRLTHGPSSNYAANPRALTISPSGDVALGGRITTPERQRSLVFSAYNAMMQNNVQYGTFLGTREIVANNFSENAMINLPISLPEGSEILGFTMIASDFNDSSNITARLIKQKFGAVPIILGSAATGFAFEDGVTTVSESFAAGARPVIEQDTSYFIEIVLDGTISSTALGFRHAKLDYTTTSP